MDNLQPTPTSEKTLQTTLEQLLRKIDGSLQQAVPLHKIEESIWQILLALGKQAMEYTIDQAGDGDRGPSITEPDGRSFNKLPQLHKRRYVSIFGVFDLHRVVYGSREGQKIQCVPLDARLGLPQSAYSYLLQNWSQLLCAESAFHKVSEALMNIFQQKVGTASLEGMNEQMAQSVPHFRDNRPPPRAETEGEIVVVSADGKGIVMRRGADDPAPSAHRSKGEKASKKRMAMVASAYSVDRYHRTAEEVVTALFRDSEENEDKPSDRPVPQSKRVMASLAGEKDGEPVSAIELAHDWMFDELIARNRREGQWQKEMVILYDGQESLWDARDRQLPNCATAILDLLHVTPRLWQAAHLFFKEKSPEAKEHVRDRCLRILQGEVSGVIRGLRRMGTDRGLKGAKAKTLSRICGYLEKNRDRMRYDEYLSKGYPIASGVIEGACRHLVKDRMERAGMHWTLKGAQAMLDVRAAYIEGSWAEYQTHRIEREQKKLYPNSEGVEGKQYKLAV